MQYQVNPEDQTPENDQNTLFWPFGSFKNAFLTLLNDPSLAIKVKDIWYYHNMQYQVNPTDLSSENGQKPLFWLFGSFKNAIFCFLNDPA